MRSKQRLSARFVVTLVPLWLAACSAGDTSTPGGESGGGGGSGTGGTSTSTGGTNTSTGGTSTGGTSTGGTNTSTGGTNTGTGGTTSTGGTNTSTGGTSTGGTNTSTGGTNTSTGGTNTSTGGTAGGSGGTVGGKGGTAGATGAGGACQKGQVAANEVLIIGDSLFPAANKEMVVELRRLAGANYLDRSVGGTKMAAIVAQYNNAPAPKPKVVIMDGGGNDVLQNPSCTPGCAEHAQAVTQFHDFLQQLATGGVVQHVVFISYYDMPSIKAGNDWMRPRLQEECQKSTVPCHFVNLVPLFAGQASSAYTTDGIHPTAAAADKCAAAIWSVMQQDCVAQ